MKACALFGHRDCPESIRPALMKAIIQLIYIEKVTMFYVGNQGRYDQIALSVLREIHKECDEFDYAVVLAYHPEERSIGEIPAEETMFPEEMEQVHPRFAISRRNDWMLAHSDYVIVYAEHSWGGRQNISTRQDRKRRTLYAYIDKKEMHKKLCISFILIYPVAFPGLPASD